MSAKGKRHWESFWIAFIARNERFILTMISKKMFSWYVVTYFFWLGKIPAEAYLYFTAAIFVIDVAQKMGGQNGLFTTGRQVPVVPNSTMDTPTALYRDGSGKLDSLDKTKSDNGDA